MELFPNSHAAAVREVRSRLHELHGTQARLKLQDDMPGSAVAIEFPHVKESSTALVADHTHP